MSALDLARFVYAVAILFIAILLGAGARRINEGARSGWALVSVAFLLVLGLIWCVAFLGLPPPNKLFQRN